MAFIKNCIYKMEGYKLMYLVDKEVIHETFGKGSVVNYNDNYIKIDFESGVKRFVFPDVFGKYMTLVDQKAANLVKIKIQKREEKKKELRLRKEKDLEQKRQHILKQKKPMQSRKVHPKQQSVFWCETGEEDKIFTEGRVFIGKVKSGKNKGQPRRLARMNWKSGCLLTRRKPGMPEKDRRILGVFMVEEGFNGQTCKDGYILAHPEYRLRLSEQESDKMLFWNYYMNKNFPTRMTWNSGRQRYFDNIWMAQILQDIVSLKKKPEEREGAQRFFEHFCKVNHINGGKLPKANGALMQIR